MEEKVIEVPVKLIMQDYQKFAKLSNEKTLVGFYGFASCAIIGNIIVNDIAGLIYLIIVFAGYEIINRVINKKQFESNKLVNKDRVYSFTENGMEYNNIDGSGNSKIKWGELYGVKQNKDILLLMTGKSSGYIIPKRFLDTALISEIEVLIINKLGPKVLKKINYLKWAGIGVLINIISVLLGGGLNVIRDRF